MKTIMLIGLARSKVGLPPYVQHLGISPELTLNVSRIEWDLGQVYGVEIDIENST